MVCAPRPSHGGSGKVPSKQLELPALWLPEDNYQRIACFFLISTYYHIFTYVFLVTGWRFQRMTCFRAPSLVKWNEAGHFKKVFQNSWCAGSSSKPQISFGTRCSLPRNCCSTMGHFSVGKSNLHETVTTSGTCSCRLSFSCVRSWDGKCWLMGLMMAFLMIIINV